MSTVNRMDATLQAPLDAPVLYHGTRIIRREGWYQLYNPDVKDTSSNEILLSHLKDSEIEARVSETFAMYRERELPFKWYVGPMSAPARLEGVISKYPHQTWEYRGMSISSQANLGSAADGLKCEFIDTSNFRDFLETAIVGWELETTRSASSDKLQRSVAHPKFRCFLVRNKDGHAIGTAASVLKEGYAYLMGAVVLKEARGLGAYRELIRARLSDLDEMGIPFAVTHAREATSAPILSRLGFETEFMARIYQFYSLKPHRNAAL